MNKQNVFVDSDVVIASLLSSSGASYLLLHTTVAKSATFFISDFSMLELQEVVKRHQIEPKQLVSLVKKRLTIQKLQKPEMVLKKYSDYVLDLSDAHIIAGAMQTKSRFIISFNQKDYKADKLKVDFNTILTTPGNFLQYLRSQG